MYSIVKGQSGPQIGLALPGAGAVQASVIPDVVLASDERNGSGFVSPDAPRSNFTTDGNRFSVRRFLSAQPLRPVNPVQELELGDEVTVIPKTLFGQGRPTNGVVTNLRLQSLHLATEQKGQWNTHEFETQKIYSIKKINSVTEEQLQTIAQDLGFDLNMRRHYVSNRKAYLEFKSTDFWAPIQRAVKVEFKLLRYMPEAKRKDYLRKVGAVILQKIQQRYGTQAIGMHYNLHGGQGPDYVDAGGIRASRGDITLQYSRHGNWNQQVYFFRTTEQSLFDILSYADSTNFLWRARMGTVLMLFRLDSPFFQKAIAEGGIIKQNPISLDVNPAWYTAQGYSGAIGIPYSEFLCPPLEVFRGTARKLGWNAPLSYDEETLATMRYLEAVLLP